MNLRSASVVAFVAGIAVTAAQAQQGAAGRWNASIDTEQGAVAVQLEFAVAGSTLTGSMTNEFTGTTPISDGTIDGQAVAFKIKFDFPDGATVVRYTGIVSGDEMKLTSQVEGAPAAAPPAITFTAARAK